MDSVGVCRQGDIDAVIHQNLSLGRSPDRSPGECDQVSGREVFLSDLNEVGLGPPDGFEDVGRAVPVRYVVAEHGFQYCSPAQARHSV